MKLAQKAFRVALTRVLGLSRLALLGAAAARGATVAAGMVSPVAAKQLAGIPNEVLGCALLRGDELETAFRESVRVGAQVLGDRNNFPARIVEAAKALDVESRVSHIAQEALKAGDTPEFWSAILAGLPESIRTAQSAAMPGFAAFTTPAAGGGSNWARTSWKAAAERRVQDMSADIAARARRQVAARRSIEPTQGRRR